MRQIVLDTETTGLEPSQGHRIIEIGAVELVNRKHTRGHFHQYINPEREVDAAALEVHGLSNEFLSDKPVFAKIIDEFLSYIEGADLIIHNAPFDVGFIDHELQLLNHSLKSITEVCTVVDSLVLARKKHPGQKNSLDALCRRYEVDNSNRKLHGALLDSEILADVYLRMTGGQTLLSLDSHEIESGVSAEQHDKRVRRKARAGKLNVCVATEGERQAHQVLLEKIDAASGGKCLWLTDA